MLSKPKRGREFLPSSLGSPRVCLSPSVFLRVCLSPSVCKHLWRETTKAFSEWQVESWKCNYWECHSLFVHISHKMTDGGGHVCCLDVSRLMIISACDFKRGHDLVFLLGGGGQLWNGIFGVMVLKYFAEREVAWLLGEMPLLFCPQIRRVSQLLSLGKRECGRNQPN